MLGVANRAALLTRAVSSGGWRLSFYFTEYFGVEPDVLDNYGAFDISVVSDLPLFVDPFLLFNSEDPTYQRLHEDILRYLLFLRDQARRGPRPEPDRRLVPLQGGQAELARLHAVRQRGRRAWAEQFAEALHGALGDILATSARRRSPSGTHLEKLCLIRAGVGRDNISDFTTNLIKDFLCEYTQTFAREHMDAEHCEEFARRRARSTTTPRTWVTEALLPAAAVRRLRAAHAGRHAHPRRDVDQLRRHGLESSASSRTPSPTTEQRANINQYFERVLGHDPNAKRGGQAAAETISRFPELDRPLHQAAGGRRRPGRVDQRAARSRTPTARWSPQIQQALADRRRTRLTSTTSRGRATRSASSGRSTSRPISRTTTATSFFNRGGQALLQREGSPARLRARLVRHRLRRQPRGQQRPRPRRLQGQLRRRGQVADRVQARQQHRSSSATSRTRSPIYEAANRTRTSVKVIVYLHGRTQARGHARSCSELKLETRSRSCLSTPATTTSRRRPRPEPSGALQRLAVTRAIGASAPIVDLNTSALCPSLTREGRDSRARGLDVATGYDVPGGAALAGPCPAAPPRKGTGARYSA